MILSKFTGLMASAKCLPFTKRKQVHIAIFAKNKPINSEKVRVFLPNEVLIEKS